MGPVDFDPVAIWNASNATAQKLASRRARLPGLPGLSMTRASQNQSTLWHVVEDAGKGQHTDALEEDAGRPDDLTDARTVYEVSSQSATFVSTMYVRCETRAMTAEEGEMSDSVPQHLLLCTCIGCKSAHARDP